MAARDVGGTVGRRVAFDCDTGQLIVDTAGNHSAHLVRPRHHVQETARNRRCDDHPQIIKDAATNAGWDVVGEAANGQQGVERYRDLRPDAVTLDLVMPEFDGLHALRGILGHDPDAKVLVVSALDQKNVLKEAFNIGAADFVPKPFDKQVLHRYAGASGGCGRGIEGFRDLGI